MSDSIHPSRQQHYCNQCNKYFTRKEGLKVHMNIHTREKQYSCYICGRVFIWAGNLKKHTFTHDPTLYKCRICGKLLKKSSTVRHSRHHFPRGNVYSSK